MPRGDLLIAFADAALSGERETIAQARDRLEIALGAAAVVDAAAVISMFQLNDRVADAIGIPLEERTAEARTEIGAVLGVDNYSA